MLRFATGRGRRHWYRRFGIESPFPWVLVAIYVIPALVVLAGVSVVVWHHY